MLNVSSNLGDTAEYTYMLLDIGDTPTLTVNPQDTTLEPERDHYLVSGALQSGHHNSDAGGRPLYCNIAQ